MLGKVITLAHKSKFIYKSSNSDEKAEFLKIISLNFLMPGKSVSFLYKNFIEELAKLRVYPYILPILNEVRTAYYQNVMDFAIIIHEVDYFLDKAGTKLPDNL